jgi:hypothetical protein
LEIQGKAWYWRIIYYYFKLLCCTGPQVTRFIIDHVQKSIDATQGIVKPVTTKRDREYDFFVLKFIKWVETNYSQSSDLLRSLFFVASHFITCIASRIFYVPDAANDHRYEPAY